MHCDRLANSDHSVCSALPANPACGRLVEDNRRRCYDECRRQDETPAPLSADKRELSIEI